MLKKLLKNKNQFFIVGAQRSGTTYIYKLLDEHPQIFMAKPVKPEPKYFLGSEFNEKEYYDTYYKNASDLIYAFGEKSTSYYENQLVAQSISTHMPLAKIIFVLADPVNRAISNYKFSFENGFESRNIEDVFINEEQVEDLDLNVMNASVSPIDYKKRGIYHRYLDYYYNCFPKKNIKVFTREEIAGNLTKVQELYKFVNCTSSFIPPSLKKIINKSNFKISNKSEILVKHRLSEFYKKHNQILFEKYQIDIRNWQ